MTEIYRGQSVGRQELSVASEADDTMLGTDTAPLTQVTIAGRDPAARPVAAPERQPIVVIPVAQGQVIELPYRADELSAKLGENGNLALRIG
jgi:hypothetical protein